MTDNNIIREEYIGRINAAITFIENNLGNDLPLHVVCKQAMYSPFHFHRLFTALTGETLNQYINRKRLEKIASSIMMGSTKSLTELGIDNGFKSTSSLSRAFKNYFGISPTEFKKSDFDEFSKIRKVESKNGQDKIVFQKYICSIDNIKKWIMKNAKIEVKQMPELSLAYMKHMGQFDQVGIVYEKLFRWAGPKGLLSNPDFKTLTVYHDDPKVTEISKVRQSVAITAPPETETSGEVNMMQLKGGKFAVGRFEISVTEFGKAWDSMCVWVAESGYKNREGEYYELYHNDHMKHPERKFILDICVPVE